jgi:hypothetical protein
MLFDYRQEVRNHRAKLFKQMAQYCFDHPELSFEQIGPEFNATPTQIARACRASGVKRQKGRIAKSVKLQVQVLSGQ